MRNSIGDKVVIAMDASERTLDWISRGMIYATVAQRPYSMAYVGLRTLADLYRYPPRAMETDLSLATVPQFVDTGAGVVTRENVGPLLDAIAADQEGM